MKSRSSFLKFLLVLALLLIVISQMPSPTFAEAKVGQKVRILKQNYRLVSMKVIRTYDYQVSSISGFSLQGTQQFTTTQSTLSTIGSTFVLSLSGHAAVQMNTFYDDGSVYDQCTESYEVAPLGSNVSVYFQKTGGVVTSYADFEVQPSSPEFEPALLTICPDKTVGVSASMALRVIEPGEEDPDCDGAEMCERISPTRLRRTQLPLEFTKEEVLEMNGERSVRSTTLQILLEKVKKKR